ncbi:hypothetical protein [uncultured Endozoicomonas sp.]|uniref:hypothetical protein n=1 Tax=uncultured Endozoicomonas sp. TaxID=432652 RepID=UPI0026247407|nr:hypothetical protein [uncultured Endozoicomonas sp.]
MIHIRKTFTQRNHDYHTKSQHKKRVLKFKKWGLSAYRKLTTSFKKAVHVIAKPVTNRKCLALPKTTLIDTYISKMIQYAIKGDLDSMAASQSLFMAQCDFYFNTKKKDCYGVDDLIDVFTTWYENLPLNSEKKIRKVLKEETSNLKMLLSAMNIIISEVHNMNSNQYKFISQYHLLISLIFKNIEDEDSYKLFDNKTMINSKGIKKTHHYKNLIRTAKNI